MGHAVVTGASSGIGEAIVTRLLRDGWRVTGLSRRDPARSEPGFTHRAVDLLDDAALVNALTGIDANALIHAAGVTRAGPLAPWT